MANKVEGTNAKPIGDKTEVPQGSSDGAHPPKLIQNLPAMGPYYKQPGANGGKKA